ncbi:FIGNL1-interacting regulator of recombination and mitosis-like [Anticarsia gemmatalis]|uniref:FIGNL1-interacting regulator of recombination and mitosis-like n=1 Tax=Anticarsia gemmatalis TaxID=129554 RepID=UPI003F772AC2
MDDSQSSDFLSQSTDIFCNSPAVHTTSMDTVTYESLVLNTKSAFSSVRKEIKKATFSAYFSTLLEDCGTCISQSLDLIADLLSETSIKVSKLTEYMSDTVCLLQLLSDLIKNVIESISMSCSSMKTFPTITGRIIMLVFTHCKDSEAVYGSQLNNVEKQIKDMFRTCHELQLTYLMVLEKHYIFDLTEKEEQDILIQALDINLKIGEIVQSLDVKTMAEQWKAYTMICEKYSCNLMDKRIYSDSTKILCAMITNNINTALEDNQEEKVIVRSLKVSSFTLKILLRVCITFKHAVIKDYDSIMELLLYANTNNEAYLHTMSGKSSQFTSLFNNNVIGPVNCLLGELLYDDKFLQCICNYNIDNIKSEDKLLGLVLVVISAIRSLLQKGGDQLAKLKKHRLINVIYSLLPHCHVWFNMGLQYKCETSSRQYQTYGLYEHLLTHTVTLASMMISEEINILEKRMLEALLSTDCLSAMFTSNLWTVLARMSSRHFLLAQVVSLCKIYQKLEDKDLFMDSPQSIHLSRTLNRLFEIMPNEDKMKIYNMYNIRDEKNMTLWCCLKINSLPNEAQCYAEDIVMEHFKTHIGKLTSNENVHINVVTKSMLLVSTCTPMNRDDEMEALLIKGWTKACPTNMKHAVKDFNKGTLWYYKYVEALVILTESTEQIFNGNSVNFVKVLHIVSSIVHSSCKQLKLLLINILCKLANFETHGENKHVSDSILTQTFSELFDNTDSIVRNKLFNTLREYKCNNLYRIVSNVVNKDEDLKEAWTRFIRCGSTKKYSSIDLREQLQSTSNFVYSHKCIEPVEELRNSEPLSLQKSLSNNFDLIDLDTLFEPEDAEPACKKAKLNINEAEEIISRLETDTLLLSKIKENVFTNEYKNRIKSLCNKLHNIID